MDTSEPTWGKDSEGSAHRRFLGGNDFLGRSVVKNMENFYLGIEKDLSKYLKQDQHSLSQSRILIFPPSRDWRARSILSETEQRMVVWKQHLCVRLIMSLILYVTAIFFISGTIKSEANFYLWLIEFLQGPGVSYRKDIRVENGTGSLPEITVGFFSCTKKVFFQIFR